MTLWAIQSMEFSRPQWVAFPFSRGSSQPRDWIQFFRIAGRFFTSWATREAQEYWSPFLQQIFPTQELTQGLLHGRQILYQLSYQKSPVDRRVLINYMWSEWMNVSSRYMVVVYTHPDIFMQTCHTVEGQIFNKWSTALKIHMRRTWAHTDV